MDNMGNLKISRIVMKNLKEWECCTLLTFCFFSVNITIVGNKSSVVCNHLYRHSLSWINEQENVVFINATKCNILSG